jgi:hypothetical protein
MFFALSNRKARKTRGGRQPPANQGKDGEVPDRTPSRWRFFDPAYRS